MRLLLLTLLLCTAPGLPRNAERAPAPAWIRCTPTSVLLAGGNQEEAVENPIARALEQARPGTTLYLDPGDYPAFTLGFDTHHDANAKTPGGKVQRPVVVEGVGKVRILGGVGEAIAVDQAVPVAHITFRNLTLVPGNRSGVRFTHREDGRVHEGFSFEGCHILGEWNPEDDSGRRSRYGVWGHRLSNFRFVGTAKEDPARVERIADEDAFYFQNNAGDVTLENVVGRDLGRAFCRASARVEDGEPGTGDLVLRSCYLEDVGLSRDHGFKGGPAIAVTGRVGGLISVQGVTFRAGFRKSRRHLSRKDEPFGTAALDVRDPGRRGSKNGMLILRDNDFRTAPGCGDRALVAIGGCQRVLILGENTFSSGGGQPALELDPVEDLGRRRSTKNGDVYLAPQTRLTGDLLVLGKPPSEDLLARLQRQ